MGAAVRIAADRLLAEMRVARVEPEGDAATRLVKDNLLATAQLGRAEWLRVEPLDRASEPRHAQPLEHVWLPQRPEHGAEFF